MIPKAENFRKDRQIISGNDRGKWKTQLGNFLENKMIRGYNFPVTTADGHILYLTSDTIGKLTSDVKDRAGNLLSDEEFRLKEEVASHIDEIVKVSKFGNHNIDDESHPHEDAWNGWDYYTAYFKDYDGQYYKFKISAKKSDIDTVYNTRNMGIRIPPTNSLTALPDQNDSGALGGGLLNNSRVPQQGKKVNSQNGENFKGSSYEDMLEAQNRRTDGRTADEVVSDIEETFANGTEMRDQARAVLNRLSALTQERENQITEDEIEGRTIIGERTAPEVKTGRAKKH